MVLNHPDQVPVVESSAVELATDKFEELEPENPAPPPIWPATAVAPLIVALSALEVESPTDKLVPLGRCHTPL